jgi:hypothetical protein
VKRLHEDSNITSRHADRYTIMVQPHPSCVNLRHAGRTNYHIHHHMILRPYHSHHTLQKQVRRTMCSNKGALRKPLYKEAMAVPLKISSELHRSHQWNPFENLIGVIASPQIWAIHNASIFTWSCNLCTWEDRIYTWPRSVGSIYWICTQLVPYGDSSW